MAKYKLGALGGSFDRLHKGHKTLLDHACSVANEIVVGITQDAMIRTKPYGYCIQPQPKRWQGVGTYLGQNYKDTIATLVTLTDIYGPTLTDTRIDCLVVSPLTEPGAKIINQKRQNMNLPQLPIEVCHLEKSSDGEHISSARIREGLINRDGLVHLEIFNKPIAMTEEQKRYLKTPLGELIPEKEVDTFKVIELPRGAKLVTIGDACSVFCFQHKLPVDVFVFDNHIERKEIADSIQTFLPASSTLICNNPAGGIQPEFAPLLLRALTEKKHIKVTGEEDLLLLPSIMLLPLGSILVYGQPGSGMVKVEVTEEKKDWCREFLSR